ncbi:MAG TPA: response regulator [Vicinamibacterales bacterium]|nr:response regulator [Vicinamibacterales bacterium]
MLSDARILVADDDPLMLDSVAEALSGMGARVTRAASGAELVDEMAAAGPFDLVVTDVAMPWMSGLTAMRAARTAGLGTAVIVMTGRRDERIPSQVRALGPNAVLLRKPFGLDDLEKVVSTLLARHGPESAATSEK